MENKPIVHETGNVGLMKAANILGFRMKKAKVDGQFCLTDGTTIGATVDEARKFLNELAGYALIQPIPGLMRESAVNSAVPVANEAPVPRFVVKTIKASRQTVADEKLFSLRTIRLELGRIYIEMEKVNKHGETFPFWLFGALNAIVGQVDLAIENRIHRVIEESNKMNDKGMEE